MKKLQGLLYDGIQMEDDFISIYIDLIKDEEFLNFFKDKRKTKELLQKLAEESRQHKKSLEQIINTF